MYVPAVSTKGLDTEDVNPFGPVQAKVAPGADVPVRFMEGVVQLMVPPVLMFAPGTVLSRVTTAVAVAVQLFAGLVTVTVYVPAAVTEGLETEELKLLGPLQTKVAPVTPDDAVMVMVVLLQFSCPPDVETSGGVVFPVTVAEAVFVQPLLPLVTVTT